jgi:hypothetical protein
VDDHHGERRDRDNDGRHTRERADVLPHSYVRLLSLVGTA